MKGAQFLGAAALGMMFGAPRDGGKSSDIFSLPAEVTRNVPSYNREKLLRTLASDAARDRKRRLLGRGPYRKPVDVPKHLRAEAYKRFRRAA